jgi:hypothetical protein
MMETDRVTSAMPDEFDRTIGMLDGLTGVTHTKPSTINVVPMLGVGGTKTFIVTTYRHRDDVADKPTSRDTVFLVVAGPDGYHRHVVPEEVIAAIIRQRDSLSARVRSKTAKRVAAERMAAGWKPTFGGKRGGRRKAKR